MKARLPQTGHPALVATGGYLVVALAMTWPLVLGLTHDLPWDLGDSLLNCYILGWDADHLLRFARGDLGALDGFWNAGIFHPEPLTLAYSEHLLAQAAQILPVYAATRNLILCYNLLFLSTFVLSALGTFLLVRELTGSSRAAFVAGLLYGFAPYRVPQFSHLQVLSSQWMPFVLFGLRRYFEGRRLWPLAGASVALVAQNLSSGYYLLFFGPFVTAYVLYEVFGRGLTRLWQVWCSLAVAALGVGLATWPLVEPYSELRALGLGLRSVGEVEVFSADVLSYVTTWPDLRVWGRVMDVFPKPEGELFPGLIPPLLAIMAVAAHSRQWWTATAAPMVEHPVRRRLVRLALAVAFLYSAVFVVALFTHSFGIGPLQIGLRHKLRLLFVAVGALSVLLLMSPRTRAFARGLSQSTVGFYLAALLAAAALSLGPIVTTAGRSMLEPGLYAVLYMYVPGFDGLRVPARYAMLVALYLAVLGGLGAAAIERRGRSGRAAIALCGLLFLVESAAVPITINGTGEVEGLNPPPPRVFTGDAVPAAYRFLRGLSSEAVVAEFPFGYDSYELRYVYYGTMHWRRLLNGYSGHFPASYLRRKAVLAVPWRYPEEAWTELVRAGTTHVVVHKAAFRDDEGSQVMGWLLSRGAATVADFTEDSVLVLPRP